MASVIRWFLNLIPFFKDGWDDEFIEDDCDDTEYNSESDPYFDQRYEGLSDEDYDDFIY